MAPISGDTYNKWILEPRRYNAEKVSGMTIAYN